jgi:eukaryotic-like serine/threonine-protein kinase
MKIPAHESGVDIAVRAYVFGDFRIDTYSFQLFRNDAAVPLPPKAFDTLLNLVRHRDRTVTKEELLAMVWPESFVTEESLTQNIFILRRVLGDDSSKSKFITTIARRGYRFVAEVNEVVVRNELAPERGHLAPKAGESDPELVTAPVPANLPAPVLEVQRGLASWGGLSRPPRWTLVAGIGILSIAILIFAIRTVRAATEAFGAPTVRFSFLPPEGTTFASGGMVSPDGRSLVFTALTEHSDRAQLWIRPLDATAPRRLAGTDDASGPFWSPDSRSLGFLSGGELKRIALNGSASEPIASISRNIFNSGSWGPGDLILFSGMGTPVYSVPAFGGIPKPATVLDSTAREMRHQSPQFLPDGKHFLYNLGSETLEQNGTYVGSLGTNERVRLLGAPSIYAWPGYLLYIRDGTLFARGFDASKFRLTGAATMIASNVVAADQANIGAVSASNNGVLSFTTSSAAERLLWFDRTGRRLGAIESQTILRHPTLFNGDKQLIAADATHSALWLVNLERSTVMRWASGGLRPVPKPDGTQIAFTSSRLSGIANIFVRKTVGSGEEDQLLVSDQENKMICDWSPDGRYLVYASLNPRTQEDLWLLPRFGDAKPIPYLRTPFNELQAQVSPDGHWIAYASDESGEWNIYVQSFPVAGNKQVISTGGGTEPHWRKDGSELFYIGPDQAIMSVPTQLGSKLQVKSPTRLFRTLLPARRVIYLNWYTVSADGQRFLIDSRESRGPDEINVIANWPRLVNR